MEARRHLRAVPTKPVIGAHYDGSGWSRNPNLRPLMVLKGPRPLRHTDRTARRFASHVLALAAGYLLHVWVS